ncbi:MULTISPECIES: hypothetical protein [Rhodococcus]|uniref:hypothetical protein n=1 Tax=Rhodococcus TaxID=1827 RepID=UPI0007AE79D5|nr:MULTISPECIES: hypothetical protein [Rhodococcus]KZL33167.1 hypothetical protein A3852_12785 [Rhodococcus qingshengii]MCE4161677.1 hypothetical protein [Rhodococcus sp. Ni2]
MTTLHADDITTLLQMCQSYDNRYIDGIMENSWHHAADIARWDMDQAEEAIRIHFATSTERIMPGHVTAIIKTFKPTQPSMDELRSNGTVSDRPAVAAIANQAFRELQANTQPSDYEKQSLSDALTWFRKTCQYDQADEPKFEQYVREGFSKYAAARKVWPWHVPGVGKVMRTGESESMKKAAEQVRESRSA